MKRLIFLEADAVVAAIFDVVRGRLESPFEEDFTRIGDGKGLKALPSDDVCVNSQL